METSRLNVVGADSEELTKSDILTTPVITSEPKARRSNAFKIRRMYLAAFSCLLMALAMGHAVGYSAPATYDMTKRPRSSVIPSDSEVTWIGSTLAIGAMIGGFCAGTLADKIGRKDTLIFNIIPYATGWLLICYAKSVLQIIIGRFLCGLGCGVISVTVPMYCVEISTAKVRGFLGSAFQGFLTIGMLICVIAGLFFTWTYLALIGAVLATFGMICFMSMPESPRWLLTKGKLDEAIDVMRNLQGDSVDAEEECKNIYEDLKGHPKGILSLEECKHPTVYKPACIAFILMFIQQFSGSNAVLFYSSNIFEVSKDFMDPRKATVVLAAVQVVATLLGNLVVDKAGRKLLLIISGLLMSLSLGALGVYYHQSSLNVIFQTEYSWIPLSSLMLFVTAFSIGYGSVPWLLAVEMVPVRARSTVSGLATFANGLAAFIVTKTFSDFKVLIGDYGVFWFYSSLSLLGTVYVVFVVPETKGKKLEEIEDLFNTKKEQQPQTEPSISAVI